MNLVLVDDNPTDRLVIRAKLRHAFPDANVYVVGEESEFAECLKRDRFDVLITDYWLGWSDGLSIIQRVRNRWPRCKVIILTGNGGEEVVAEAFNYGLFHYLLKPNGLEPLIKVVRLALDSKRREDRIEAPAALADSIPDAVHGVDTSGTITSWNSAASRLLGYTIEETLGRKMEMMVPRHARAQDRGMFARALRGGTIRDHATLRQRSDGAEIEVLASLSPIRNEAQEISGVAILLRPAHADSDRRRQAVNADRDGVAVSLRSSD